MVLQFHCRRGMSRQRLRPSWEVPTIKLPSLIRHPDARPKGENRVSMLMTLGMKTHPDGAVESD